MLAGRSNVGGPTRIGSVREIRPHIQRVVEHEDPICGRRIGFVQIHAIRSAGARTFVFCSPGCVEQFDLIRRALELTAIRRGS